MNKLWRVLLALLVIASALTITTGVASAHHVTLSGVKSCLAEDGSWSVTWSAKNSEANKAMTIEDVDLDTDSNPGGPFDNVGNPGNPTLTPNPVPFSGTATGVSNFGSGVARVKLEVEVDWPNFSGTDKDDVTISRPTEQCHEDTDITVTANCDGITILSEKDLSNLVFGRGANATKVETGYGIGTEDGFIPIDRTITHIWVKSGANHSGDGPGYGERFEITWPTVQSCTDKPDPETDERVNCETSEIVSYETPYVWDEQTQTYVPGVEVETGRRAATPAELNEAECPGPDQPEPDERQESATEVNCETEMVETWTTYFETPYVYDEANRTWNLGAEVQVGERVKTDERPATVEELNEKECPETEQPDPKARQTVTETLNCADRNVTVTTTNFETPQVWDVETRTWIDSDEKQVSQSVEVRAASPEELEDCPTTTTVPPTTIPPTTVPGPSGSPSAFAHTGTGTTVLVAVALGLAGVGALLVAASRRKRDA